MVRRKRDSRSIARSTTGKDKQSNTAVIVERNPKKRAHTRALQQIRYLRRTVDLLIPRAAFIRLVREIMRDLFPRAGIERIYPSALEALQEATEAYIVQFFEDSSLVAYHAKRVTLQRQDMILMRRLRGRDDIINR